MINIIFTIIAIVLLVPVLITIVIALIKSIKEKSIFGLIVSLWLLLSIFGAAYPIIKYLSGNHLKIEWLERAYNHSEEYYVNEL